ncbi:MAG: hypothetical protein AAB229_07350 [Candidatus Hydrogenedentota bacterium]
MKTTIARHRVFAPTVTAVATRTGFFEIADDQTFANTSTTWEIWQDDPHICRRKIPRRHVFWVFENERYDTFFAHCSPPRKKVVTAFRHVRTK